MTLASRVWNITFNVDEASGPVYLSRFFLRLVTHYISAGVQDQCMNKARVKPPALWTLLY